MKKSSNNEVHKNISDTKNHQTEILNNKTKNTTSTGTSNKKKSNVKKTFIVQDE